MAKRRNDDDSAAGGAILALLRNMPADARRAVLKDVEKHADAEAKAQIGEIIDVEKILHGRDLRR